MYLTTVNGTTILSVEAPVVQDAYNVEVPVRISTLVASARRLYNAGYKIDAIRLVRPFVPGLKEAKDFVDSEFGEKTPSKIEWPD